MRIPKATLDLENRVVLAFVQALIGLVSPAIRGVAVQVDHDTVTVLLRGR